MFIFRCGGMSDLTSEDYERSNSRWTLFHLNFKTCIILEQNSVEKTFKVSFPTNLGMPIHSVILLRSPEPKVMHLHQGQGQITLKTFGWDFFLLICLF